MAATVHPIRGMTVPDDDERHVSMSNRLARASHSLNLAEKRLIALSLASTDSAATHLLQSGVNSGWKVRVNALEYAEAFGLDPTTAYEQVRAAATQLFERQVHFEVHNSKGKAVEKRLRWVSGCVYVEGDGHVEINFSPEVAPHLLGLRQQFTTYKLRHAANFDTVYAWRLFEVLKSWQNTGLYRVEIADFHELMEVPESCKADFRQLRVRVLEPALASIRAKAGLVVEWTPWREGSRKTKGLIFTFHQDPQGSLLAEPEHSGTEPPCPTESEPARIDAPSTTP